MKRTVTIIGTTALAALCLAACAGRSAGSGNASAAETPPAEARQAEKAEAGDAFPYPAIPDTLTDPEARRACLLEHYWSRYDFTDTLLLADRAVTEQGFVDFIALMGAPADTPLRERSCEGLCSRLEGAGDEAIAAFSALADDYLYQPNSPMHDEALYEVWLRRMARSRTVEEHWRQSFAFKLRIVARNRPGEVAADFGYVLPDGRRSSLHATPVRGDRLVVLFYDPECGTCSEVTERMLADKLLKEALEAGRCSLLAVYTENSEEAWRKSSGRFPRTWTVANDRGAVRDGLLYDLKAMPTLYLLDAKKRVVLKDASFDAIRARIGTE